MNKMIEKDPEPQEIIHWRAGNIKGKASNVSPENREFLVLKQYISLYNFQQNCRRIVVENENDLFLFIFFYKNIWSWKYINH